MAFRFTQRQPFKIVKKLLRRNFRPKLVAFIRHGKGVYDLDPHELNDRPINIRQFQNTLPIYDRCFCGTKIIRYNDLELTHLYQYSATYS